MDIALNVTTAPQVQRSKVVVKKPQLTNVKASKKSKAAGVAASSGFSFQFGGGAGKIKAVVARKRPVKTLAVPLKEQNAVASNDVNASKQSPPLPTIAKKSVALKRKAPTNFVVAPSKRAPNKDDDDDGGGGGGDSGNESSDLESYAKVKKTGVDGSETALMLNVCSKPLAAAAPPKPKLTKSERFSQRRAERMLKQQERKEGLNKAKLKQPRRMLAAHDNAAMRNDEFASGFEVVPKVGDPPNETKEEAKEADKVDEEEVPKVDPKARKANAFRVKRPEDSSVKKIRLFEKNPEAKEMGQRLVKPIVERLFDGTKIDTIGLHAHAVKNLADLLSITELTTVQKKAIPKALAGHDLLVRSQTGSGKTLAYALPLVEKLHERRPKIARDEGILGVVIVPTRELAIQTYELFVKLLKPFTWIVPGVLMGGERRKAEKARLRKGINILVGTPGRLVDHLLHTESFKLNKARFLVLDEADRLLEMGYERDVKQIVEAIDTQRKQLADETKEPAVHMQRMLLSATLTAAVQKLAGLTLQEPIFIDNSDEDPATAQKHTAGYNKESIEAATTQLALDEEDEGILTIPENLLLSYIVVPPKLRLVTLSGLLAKEFVGKEKLKAVVFMSTTEMVAYHHDLLNEALTQRIIDEDDELNEVDSKNGEEPLLVGLRFFKLYGSMTQTERQGVFKSFRECKSGVLLATDVAGRGIDVPEIDLVVQYSPPQRTADFVHRAGRTARAGRRGRAVLFLTPNEVKFVRYLEEKRIRICQVDMDFYLQALVDADDKARNIQEAASNLQYKFQELILDDKELHDKGCKAFVSWVKFQSSFPRALKPIFNVKSAHMGHYAKSLGLKDEPASFTRKHSKPKAPPPTNRLTYTERDPEKMKADKHGSNQNKKHRFATTVTNETRNTTRQHGGGNAAGPNRLMQMLSSSRALTTSEFDSGLPAFKKQKRTNA